MYNSLTIEIDTVHKINVVVTGETSKRPVVVLHGGQLYGNNRSIEISQKDNPEKIIINNKKYEIFERHN